MSYQLTQGGTVLRLADNVFIPPDLGNVDYQAFLAWQKEGNTPDPAPEPEPASELTPAEKLAAVGLTIDDLRALLAEI